MHGCMGVVAVHGVEDETWREYVTAFIGLKPGETLGFGELRAWCDGKMSSYKIPKSIKLIDALPRNAMGKVTKPALKAML